MGYTVIIFAYGTLLQVENSQIYMQYKFRVHALLVSFVAFIQKDTFNSWRSECRNVLVKKQTPFRGGGVGNNNKFNKKDNFAEIFVNAHGHDNERY